MKKKMKIAISHGDINGISYEIILKSLSDERMSEICTPIVYGSLDTLKYYQRKLNIPRGNFSIMKDLSSITQGKPIFLNCIKTPDVQLGQQNKEAGESAFQSLERATSDVVNKHADVLVTAPINKGSIQSESFTFPGHTEYLREKLQAEESLMLMVSEHLRVAMVTNHEPLKAVDELITEELLKSKFNLLVASMEKDFGITKPKIAILGLNPHAGEGGVLGEKENEVITPFVAEQKDNGHLVYGPFAADGLFGNGKYKDYDAILAMYHDQGMIPFKMLSVTDGVNFTAGLPIVRTSPAHGTAFEIAGQGVASCDSLRSAIYHAIDIQRNRDVYVAINSNKLKVRKAPPRDRKA